ncbi:MAG: DUF2092 domain-containing protein [Myxococcota bacterium]
MRSSATSARWLALLCVAGLASGFTATSARAAEPAAEQPAAAATPEDDIDPKALALFTAFGKALEAQPRFSFAVDFSYDVVQEDGQKLEFGASRVYTVRRPDHLRIDEKRRVGGVREIFFDGNRLAVYVPGDKAYALAKLKQHRDLDSMIDVVRDALDMPIPLGDLLRAHPLKRIEEGMHTAYVVGRESLGGVECEHVAWQTDEVDAEAWFTLSDLPLLHRVVIDYRELDGQPSFRAQFTNWNRTPGVADSVFEFTPPPDVERVRFSVRGRNVEPTEVEEP